MSTVTLVNTRTITASVWSRPEFWSHVSFRRHRNVGFQLMLATVARPKESDLYQKPQNVQSHNNIQVPYRKEHIVTSSAIAVAPEELDPCSC